MPYLKSILEEGTARGEAPARSRLGLTSSFYQPDFGPLLQLPRPQFARLGHLLTSLVPAASDKS